MKSTTYAGMPKPAGRSGHFHESRRHSLQARGMRTGHLGHKPLPYNLEVSHIAPNPGQVGAVRINLNDDEVSIVKNEFNTELSTGKAALFDNELWVWKKDEKKWLDDLGIPYPSWEFKDED